MGISVQTDMATPSLHQFGTDELRERYLVPAVKGEMVAAIAVTEPDAGSDVAGIKTRAVRDGDDWVINGSKIYITNAATADWLCLLAVTDPEAGYGGFSQIVVPTDSPGFTLPAARQDRELGLGHRAALLRGRARAGRQHHRRHRPRLPAADDAVPGRAPGRLRQLERRRPRRCGRRPSSYCEERIVFKKPLSKMQVTQFKFVEMLTQITAATRADARLRPQARRAARTRRMEISMAKLFCGRMARCVADECIQLHGGFGYMKESVAGRAFVDTRLISIGGGADEVMIHYMAKMLGLLETRGQRLALAASRAGPTPAPRARARCGA